MDKKYNIFHSHRSPTQEKVLLLSTYLELFLGCSCRPYMFRVVLFFKNLNFSQNIVTYTFTKNGFHVRFDKKVRQTLLQSGVALMYYKVGQVLFQNMGAFCTTREIQYSPWCY